MVESPNLEEQKLIKVVQNLFTLVLRKDAIDTAIEDMRNIFRLEKENEEIKDRILEDIINHFSLEKENKEIEDIIFRNIRNLFENEKEENYYKPGRV